MFNNIDDIRKEIYRFRKKTNRYPNVIFIPYNERCEIYNLFNGHFSIDNYNYKIIEQITGNITIFGIKVKWTENIFGVDYIEEFDDISEQIYQQQQNFPKQQYEYFNKVLKPLMKLESAKPKKNKGRKIIL